MLNIERTKEVFGYQVTLERTRRTLKDVASTGGVQPKNLLVIDNCPECTVERVIKLRQSRKNKPCSKCFHNSPEMILAKQNQKKEKSEEHKKKMREGHWSRHGGVSAFKGKTHTDEAKERLRRAAIQQAAACTPDQKLMQNIKGSCTQRGIPIEDFHGFSAPENIRIRQSPEGKAWRYDVMSKANFTCDRCAERGGNLHAHHLNAFNSYPEQRFDVDNGVCLCHRCHEEFHSKYGKGYNTREQYSEFKAL